MQRITSLKETGFRATPSTGGYKPVSEFFLVNENLDLRGRRLRQDDGNTDITVSDMLVDPDTQRVALIELSDGRRIPIENVRLQGSYIRLEF